MLSEYEAAKHTTTPSMKQKRRLVAVVRKQLHRGGCTAAPPVPKMTRLQICQYVYGTTKEMDVGWGPYFEKAVQRKRIPKGCFDICLTCPVPARMITWNQNPKESVQRRR